MSIGRNFYEKKIKYLDYFEGQMRIGGGGFVKLEVRDGKLRMDLTVTGLHATDTFARDMVLCGKGRERVAGRIDISGGRGQYRQQWQNLEDIGGTGIGYWELQESAFPGGRAGGFRQMAGDGDAGQGKAGCGIGRTAIRRRLCEGGSRNPRGIQGRGTEERKDCRGAIWRWRRRSGGGEI